MTQRIAELDARIETRERRIRELLARPQDLHTLAELREMQQESEALAARLRAARDEAIARLRHWDQQARLVQALRTGPSVPTQADYQA